MSQTAVKNVAISVSDDVMLESLCAATKRGKKHMLSLLIEQEHKKLINSDSLKNVRPNGRKR